MTPTTSGAHLLDAIIATHAKVGDGLNDEEFTQFLQSTSPPTEAGFKFLCFSNQIVTLAVPAQDLANWYQENGRITAKKETAVNVISQKYGFSLSAPPDTGGKYSSTRRDALPPPHHHLELSYNRESIIVFHPCYLKIRLFRIFGITQHVCNPPKALPSVSGLLSDISLVYQA